MRCKHEKLLSKCDICLSKTLAYLIKSINPKCYAQCYANAFILLPNATSTIVRTFTQEEITDQNQCLTVPLTSACSGSYFQLSSCKSPKDKWCKVIDQANGYITSLQVPECCCGCYNFDLSASVALTSTFSFTLAIVNSVTVSLSYDINLPVKASLRLSEQLPREVCVADELADRPESCFTSVTFPIIDTPMASAALGGQNFLPSITDLQNIIGNIIFNPILESNLSQTPNFINLAVSGAVCLKGCQRLVPTLTISPFDPSGIIGILTQFFDLNIGGAFTIDVTFTNTKLHLSDLSLKLVKIGDCAETCDC